MARAAVSPTSASSTATLSARGAAGPASDRCGSLRNDLPSAERKVA